MPEAAAIERYIVLLEELGAPLGEPFAKMIDRRARIFELRPGNHRVAYASHADTYVLLHAWRKRGQKLDAAALATARSRLDAWERRYPERRLPDA
jgi:phage-related protein